MKQPIHILVVEDDAVLRKVVASLLAKMATVTTAESGRAAIALLRDRRFDMIFSDVCMPDGDGVELLDWVQASLPIPPPLVFVTGHASISHDEAREKGAYTVIDKPFKMRTLLDLALELSASLELGKAKPA